MTEAEWLASADPQPMLGFLRGKAGDRKLRLFAVACCRRIRHLLVDEVSRKAVEVGERAADGLTTKNEEYDAYQESDDVRAMLGDAFDELLIEPDNQYALAITAAGVHWFAAAEAADAATASVDDDGELAAYIPAAIAVGWVKGAGYEFDQQVKAAEQASQAALVRDIFGNLFRPATVDPTVRTPAVVTLAHTVYEARSFDRLPELADALEEAGCDDADVLAHCRQPGPHVRGCWVVDLILGKG